MSLSDASLQLVHAPWSGQYCVSALTTTRIGGCSSAPFDDGSGQGGLNVAQHVGDETAAVASNRAQLSSLVPSGPCWLNQVHGISVIDASSMPVLPVGTPTADAAVTARPGQVLAIVTADCLPVLFVDWQAGVIGAAHAGWRGLAGGILPATVAAMVRLGARVDSIKAWIGPAIGAAAFEVGAEVPAAFADSPAFDRLDTGNYFQPVAQRGDKWLGDLPGLATAQMMAVGVSSVTGGSHCTVSDTRFYSYRRDGQTGRMVSLIWMDAD